ncbi:MAG: recombinase family protein [Thermoanaerobaculia bacterium]
MSTAVTYTRVSSKEQLKEGFSIPAQQAILDRYAKDQGLNIVARFSDDETAKARSTRTDFTRMLNHLERHDRDRVILVEKTDRLYRNLKDYLALDDLGVAIHFVKEGTVISSESHSSARFLHGIKVLMARNYVENLSEEVKKGMHEKARQGHWPTAAPIAYNNTKSPGGITPDPILGPIVRELFELAATGRYSIGDLTLHAKRAGLVTRHGHPVAKSKIARLLQHEAYTGTFTWGGKTYHGIYEPVITHDLFTRVQDVISGRRQPRTQRHTFTYTGRISCATCNGMLTGDIKKQRYTYYACKGTKGCKRYYPENLFDESTTQVLTSLRIDHAISDWLITDLANWFDEEQERRANSAERTQARIAELRRLQTRAYEDKLRGTITETQWREHHERWQNEIDEQHSQDASSSRDEFLARIRMPFELVQTAHDQYVTQNSAERARLLDALGSNYTVTDGRVSVSVGSPFDVLLRAAERSDWLGDRESNPD